MRYSVLMLLVMYSIVFCKQYTWFDGTIEFTSNARVACKQFEGPSSLKSPDNYLNGNCYMRAEVLEKASSRELCVQTCNWKVGETCSPCGGLKFSNKGQVVYFERAVGDWWKKSSSNWGSNANAGCWVLKDKSTNKWMDDCGGSHCFGSGANQHLPVKLKITVINSTGGPVELPDDWECQSGWNCGGSPTSARTAVASQQKETLKILHSAARDIAIETPEKQGKILIITFTGRFVHVQKTNNGSITLAKAAILPGPCIVKWIGKNKTISRIMLGF